MNERKIIGTTQYVQLSDHSSAVIPAKIDTGADDSALWATSIAELDGELSFILFAPQSVFYTGEIHKTRDYRFTLVRNSFGEREYRYKVQLKLKIIGKTYRVSFNLADRSHNRYPILIGKRFLSRRFIVDVSQRNIGDEPVHAEGESPVIVLTSRLDEATKSFFRLVQQELSSKILLERYRLLQFEVNDNGEPKILLGDGSDVANAKIVYFKAHSLYPEHVSAVVAYLHYKHVPFIDQELAHFVSRSKLSELFVLATNGIPVPAMRVVTGQKNIPSYDELKSVLGEIFVIKDATSDRGKDNFLVTNTSSFAEALERLQSTKTYIVQRYIKNDGFTRVLLIGSEVVQVVRRSTALHDDPLRAHLNKPHGGVNAQVIPVADYSSDVIALARKAALAMRRGVAGVDLIQDKITQKWYVLEVNYNPEVVSGINVSQKAEGLARLLESNNK